MLNTLTQIITLTQILVSLPANAQVALIICLFLYMLVLLFVIVFVPKAHERIAHVIDAMRSSSYDRNNQQERK